MTICECFHNLSSTARKANQLTITLFKKHSYKTAFPLLLVHFCQMTYSIYEEIAPKKALLKIKVITFSGGGQIGFVTKITKTVTQTHPSWVGWSIGLNRCFGFLEIVICPELNSHMETMQTGLSNSPLSSTKWTLKTCANLLSSN